MATLAELGEISKALLPKYALETSQQGHRLTRTPGLIARRKGIGPSQSHYFKGEGPTGGVPGYQLDSQKRKLSEQASQYARSRKR